MFLQALQDAAKAVTIRAQPQQSQAEVVSHAREKRAQPKAVCNPNDIIHQLSTLRKENCFLKLRFILCLVLSTLPHLLGFQFQRMVTTVQV